MTTKALFITTAAHELYGPVNAWRNSMGPCGHITFNPHDTPNDDALLACARGYKPDVIFYIGAIDGGGLPSIETFQTLRKIAKIVHYQSDMEDETWHELLTRYRENECFDLCVSQTGVKTPHADYVTLIAIDLLPYESPTIIYGSRRNARPIPCGFSGSHQNLKQYKEAGEGDPRSSLLHNTGRHLRLRAREPVGDYADYVKFFRSCRMIFNVSLTGLGTHHHVKWRVLEAAFAGCALLEMRESPTSDWFPEDTYFTYGDAKEAGHIILDTPKDEVQRRAEAFNIHARAHYTPDKIYQGILDRL